MWLNNLATVSLNFGAIDDAERYNGEALKLREVVGDKGTRLASQIDFARVQEARGNVRRAENAYLEAIRLSDDRPDKQLLSVA